MITGNRPNYSENALRNELSVVFSSVYFEDKQEQHILFDSYFLNIRGFINYARNNGIDEMDYIRSIRSKLLESPKIHEMY